MKREILLADKTRGFEQAASFEDRRMWRRLLAQLHPDAGGDRELFAFACSVKEEVRGGERPEGELILRAWREAMGCWASRNRETLKNF